MSTVPGDSPEREGPPRRARYVCFGEFYLDLEREEAFQDGRRIRLHGKVYRALLTLLERPGDTVSREELRARLWPSGIHINYDANVNTTVNKLRQLLGDTSEKAAFIETVPRKGYCFVASVVYQDHPPVRRIAREGGSRGAATEILAGTAAQTTVSDKDSRKWFIAGVVALTIAAMLLGAAVAFYFHRSI